MHSCIMRIRLLVVQNKEECTPKLVMLATLDALFAATGLLKAKTAFKTMTKNTAAFALWDLFAVSGKRIMSLIPR